MGLTTEESLAVRPEGASKGQVASECAAQLAAVLAVVCRIWVVPALVWEDGLPPSSAGGWWGGNSNEWSLSRFGALKRG